MSIHKKLAKKIVKAIIRDIEDRSGIGNEWEQIDPDIQDEIRKEWKKKIVSVLDENQGL